MRMRQSRVWTPRPEHGGAPLYYYDRDIEAQAAKILPGEYIATSRDIALVTLLGSCVAACLRDPLAGVGGINHFMLPEGGSDVVGESARYGGYAMEMLVNELLKRGADRARLEAKVFGGGNVIKGFTAANIGEKNAGFVREYLARERIPILAADLLNGHPRRVYYFPRTGRALVKRLPAVTGTGIDEIESLYRDRLKSEPPETGEVELFDVPVAAPKKAVAGGGR